MKFGTCPDCSEYKYLEPDSGLCPTCSEKTIYEKLEKAAVTPEDIVNNLN